MCWDVIIVGNVVFLIYVLAVNNHPRTFSHKLFFFVPSLIIIPLHVFDFHSYSTVSWWVSAVMAPSAAQHQHCPSITTMTLNVTLLWTDGSKSEPMAERCHYLLCVNTVSRVRVCVCACILILQKHVGKQKENIIKNRLFTLITKQGY